VRAPVNEPAMKPARDLRGARGSPKNEAGNAGVYRPHRRPNVDAFVSAHAKLQSVLAKGVM
jgi:hypothetical protein